MNKILGLILLLAISQTFASDLLPSKKVVSLSGAPTKTEIYISATVYTDVNTPYVPTRNISLPRTIKIESKIKPDAAHLGKLGHLFLAIRIGKEWHLLDDRGGLNSYGGGELIFYDNAVLTEEMDLSPINAVVNQEHEGEYQLVTGYAVDDDVFFNEEVGVMNLLVNWAIKPKLKLSGSDLEELNPSCVRSSMRYSPIVNFDVNLDGIYDFILPIYCYQIDERPETQVHNVAVRPAWKIFCSSMQNHFDCTHDLFGDDFIDHTLGDAFGGIAYDSVMDNPRDINGDGYPDFWFASNRDDDRRSPDWSDIELVQNICPERESWETWGLNGQDCTYTSMQSLFLSRADGTYQIVPFIPWGRFSIHNLHAFENNHGGWDFIGWGGSGWRAARLDGRELHDVTEEYKSLINIDWVDGFYSRPVSYEGKSYFVTPMVPAPAITSPAGESLGHFSNDWHYGISLWEFRAGKGFILSDYHTVSEDDIFDINFTEGSNVVSERAIKIKGGLVIKPNPFFFRFQKLAPEEDPVLIVWHESDAGSTFGKYFKAPPDTDATYRYWDINNPPTEISSPRSPYWVSNQLNAVEGFYIRDGKLVERKKSVIEDDFVFKITRMDFVDLNNDGAIDMLGSLSQVYLNDGEGTFRKVDTQGMWPFELDVGGDADAGYRGQFVQFDPSGQKLDFIYYNRGWSYPRYAGYVNKPGDVGILEGIRNIDDVEIQSTSNFQDDIERCFLTQPYNRLCYFY